VMIYTLHEVPSEAAADATPESLLREFTYAEDPVDQLSRFTAVATATVAGAASAPERARRLGDYLYSLRQTDKRGFVQDLRHGPEVLLDLVQEGWLPSCGQATVVFATLWRSLGGHSKMVRWANRAGTEGHYSVSLWDEDRQSWFYYDLNLNGFLADGATGRALAPSEVRASLLNGATPAVNAHPSWRDYTIEDLRDTIARFPVELFVLNNDYLRWSPQYRFGTLNPFHDTLAALPRPLDRFVDNLTGHRDRRMTVTGRIFVRGLLPVPVGRVAFLYLLLVLVIGLIALVRGTRGRSQHPRVGPA